MILYKAVITPRTSFASPLQSDTLFGAFCWSYKYLYGDGMLEALLQESIRNQEHGIIFSNAFPAGCLPLPMGVYDEGRTRYSAVGKADAKKAYQENKKYKKYSLVQRDAFINIQRGSRSGYSGHLAGERTVQDETVHNMVSRSAGTVGRMEESGSLFVTGEYFVREDEAFDVYILSDLDRDVIEKVISLMLELGIGADKSTGKGGFQLLSFDEERELGCVNDANGYMALSNFIPAQSDPMEGWYKTFVKYGKLDREFAAGYFPFKKPLLYLQAGAVFKTDKVAACYGRYVEDISAVEGVVVNACTIAIPMKLP